MTGIFPRIFVSSTVKVDGQARMRAFFLAWCPNCLPIRCNRVQT